MLIKTLADEKYEVDVAETATVAEVKAKLEAMDIGAPADRSKIIFRGRVLADSAELSSLGIAPGDFMVLMKPKPAPAASAAAPVAAPTPPPAPAPAPEPDPAPAPPPAAPPGVDAAVVDSLVEMGFPRDAVVVALTAAFGNADRAAQYLFDPSSMPAESAPPAAPPPEATPLAAAPPTAAPAAPAATPVFTADNILAAIGGAAPAAPPPLTPLQRMLSEPRLMQCVTLARQDPSQLGPLLQQLSTEAPAILTLLQAHQAEFQQLLTMENIEAAFTEAVAARNAQAAPPGGGGGGGGGTVQIHVTAEEAAAIGRLQQLGFSRDAALQAFLACEKNEALAVCTASA